MDHWPGLTSGRSSLVDRFDSDGRRFVVAVKNDPEFPDPRGLTTRERQVCEFIGIGQSTKEITLSQIEGADRTERAVNRCLGGYAGIFSGLANRHFVFLERSVELRSASKAVARTRGGRWNADASLSAHVPLPRATGSQLSRTAAASYQLSELVSSSSRQRAEHCVSVR
jgi:hypothetical protein